MNPTGLGWKTLDDKIGGKVQLGRDDPVRDQYQDPSSVVSTSPLVTVDSESKLTRSASLTENPGKPSRWPRLPAFQPR